jgi:hypothetical protein
MSEARIYDALNNTINLIRKKMEGYRDDIAELRKENYALRQQLNTTSGKFVVVERHDDLYMSIPLHRGSENGYGIATFPTVNDGIKFVNNLLGTEGIVWEFKSSQYDSFKAVGVTNDGRKFAVVFCN